MHIDTQKVEEQRSTLNVLEAEAQVYIHRTCNKEMKIGIEVARNEVNSYKEVISRITEQLKVSHDSHQRKIKAIMIEYKENCQDELRRRQEEISKLHEVMGHWMHQCMELQEEVGIPSSGGNATHRRTLSKKYRDMIRVLCDKTESISKGISVKKNTIISCHMGDKSPPLFYE